MAEPGPSCAHLSSGGCTSLGRLRACCFPDGASGAVTLIRFHAGANELSCAKASVHIPDCSSQRDVLSFFT